MYQRLREFYRYRGWIRVWRFYKSPFDCFNRTLYFSRYWLKISKYICVSGFVEILPLREYILINFHSSNIGWWLVNRLMWKCAITRVKSMKLTLFFLRILMINTLTVFQYFWISISDGKTRLDIMYICSFFL